MKRNLFLSLLAFALVLPAFSIQAQNAADEKAILATCKEGFDAFNAFDADRFALVYTETAVVVNPMGGLIEGRENIRQAHKALFQMWGGNPQGNGYTWEKQTLRFITPEVAIINIVSANSRNNAITDRMAYSLTVVKKNGKWLCENIQITPIVTPPGKPQN
ncbi:YybH family protein [Haliscomenobacter hydrossis]|uniref:DUF4440 domain-containing protein n=1 Tax=Haliscomenobacter hydrossis (strain ATCC 27775 / DSM 1100 / LMG 10767 / O) TaxID=760192 RepID=F4KSY4_HALH1|nr:SgcJ/EcaC family oxidoreductase [Haliscomenobacter hydrossis]AEE49091.1 hypothetical protein Halhy_1194 [Haliscomenobacter hydrossis DSM 1100]